MKLWILAILFWGASASASVSGTLKSSTDFYPDDLGEPTEPITPFLMLDFNAKTKINKRLRFQGRLFSLSNPESKGPPENIYVDVPEAFVEHKTTPALRLRLGMNTVNWGITDVSSPSDVVNPLAIFHPLRIYKRGSPMLEAEYNKEVIGVHAVYIPRQRRPLLPSEDSRWLPRQFLINVGYGGDTVTVPKFLDYEIDGDEVLESGSKRQVLSTNALDHNAGMRLSSHLGSLDLFAMHFEGAAPQPKVRPTINVITSPSLQATSPIRLKPLYYRVRTTSGGFVWALEKMIVRAETAYQHTINKDPLLQPWMWSNVLAAETNLSLGSTSLILLGQYYHTVNPQAPDNLISSSYRLFDRTFVAGARWAWSEKLTIMASALFETQTRGLFATLGFENKISDSMRWGLGWRDFSAADEGLLKTFDRNDHATLDLTYFF